MSARTPSAGKTTPENEQNGADLDQQVDHHQAERTGNPEVEECIDERMSAVAKEVLPP
jgi:hypothetical protein